MRLRPTTMPLEQVTPAQAFTQGSPLPAFHDDKEEGLPRSAATWTSAFTGVGGGGGEGGG